jgi:D-glycero-D-manno-heptose 1,7-bisphosphate phosphatase
MPGQRQAVFLDRDGTLNARPAEHSYVESPAGFVWLDGAIEGAAALARAGFVLAVVSNQRGVARGLVSWPTLRSIEVEIQTSLRQHGAEIAAFRYCPHDLDEECDCRKPAPGMILDLARTLDIDLARSWMIGDSESDVLAGHSAGCRTALIDESRQLDPAHPHAPPDIVGPSLRAAAAAILEWRDGESLSPS